MEPKTRNQKAITKLCVYSLTFKSSASEIEEYFGMPSGKIYSKSRKREICVPRQIAMYFDHLKIKKNTEQKGASAISRAFKCNHVTVLNAISVVQEMMIYPEFKKMMEEINKTVFSAAYTSQLNQIH